MPEFKPKARAKSGETLNEALKGELARYEKVGLFSRAITKRSAYRYRGVFLKYQSSPRQTAVARGFTLLFGTP